MMRNKSLFTLVALLVVLVGTLVTAGSSRAAQAPPVLVDRSGGPEYGLEVTLSADRAPRSGETATLTFEVKALRDIQALEITWQTPPGAALVGDPVEQLGSLSAGDTAASTRGVSFPGSGTFRVAAAAGFSAGLDTRYGAAGVLFFTVSDRTASVSDLDPAARSPMGTPLERLVTHTATPASDRAVDDPCFTINGFVQRTERPTNINGYGANIKVPVPFARVEVREEDTLFDDVYDDFTTDANGRFTSKFCDDDGFFDEELEIYVRLHAEIYIDDHLIAEVEDSTWIEENYEFDTEPFDSEGGTYDVIMDLDMTQSAIFNMADAALDAWLVWGDNGGEAGGDSRFDEEAEIQWEPGEGQEGSLYNSFFGEIRIADDPSNGDEWDDSVIIHEWGHMADDHYSCDDNPGGAHNLGDLINFELSWGEGYPDYWQSAVRRARGRANPSYYMDMNGASLPGISVNLDTYSRSDGGKVGDEMSIAGALWDLIDADAPGDDKVQYSPGLLQQVYTGDSFESIAYGFFDDTCDLPSYFKAWLAEGKPQDADTAAAISQNVNLSLALLQANPDGTGLTARGADSAEAASAVSPYAARWWDQVTMVVDTSASMAGPGGASKIDSVKTIIAEQANDLTNTPQGTEFNIYTFDAATFRPVPLLEGKFYEEQIVPAVNGLGASGADFGCYVNGLYALREASLDKFRGEVWLYTDGDTLEAITTEDLRRRFNERQLRGSVVLLGGCSNPPAKQSSVSGGERTYLKLAADGSQPTGMVPYLLTALGTGGQFVYVAPDQLANAVDVARAQLSHTAGAGRWSDYVSNVYTYRWDRLEPWEYQWFPAESLGQDAGQLYSSPGLRLNMPNAFPFYGHETSVVDVFEDGTIRMDPCLTEPFCPGLTSQWLNLLYRDLHWRYIQPGPNDAPDRPQAAAETGPQVHVYTANFAFEWYIISTQGTADYDPGPGTDFDYRAYQTWLNYETGEIRFQYDRVRDDAAQAEISLIDDGVFVTAGNVVVSKNDISGASSGTGYKFTPAPPQPARIYEVDVDPLIESVVFLQTGYSGTFAPMTVLDPDGTPVNCADTANVKCLTVDNKPGDHMVQFVQVDTNGRSGLYTATVAVGPGGSGTFSFNALAASALELSSPGKHTLSLNAHRFLVDLGRSSDNGMLQGWLQLPNGTVAGNPFPLYDDGAHGDGVADDGRFGSDMITPPVTGAAYLWTAGTVDGFALKRSDPVPYNFQPVDVSATPARQEAFYGDSVLVYFPIHNQDSADHCYALEFNAPDGWTANTPFIYGHCVAAGQSSAPYATFSRQPGPDALGEMGEVSMTALETYEGAIAGSASARIEWFPRPALLEFENLWSDKPVPPGGQAISLGLAMHDDRGYLIDYNGPFSGELTAVGGQVTAPTGMYEKGILPLLFTPGGQAGTATISALAEGGLTAETTIRLAEPVGFSLALTGTPTQLGDAEQAALVATVLDIYGRPARGETVRLGVSDDDGERGTINGAEYFDGATDRDGEMRATVRKTPGAQGQVIVRAQLLGENGEVLREANLVLELSIVAAGWNTFLPIQVRGR